MPLGFSKLLRKLSVKYVSIYTKGTLSRKISGGLYEERIYGMDMELMLMEFGF